jgi:hypothetical protein
MGGQAVEGGNGREGDWTGKGARVFNCGACKDTFVSHCSCIKIICQRTLSSSALALIVRKFSSNPLGKIGLSFEVTLYNKSLS